MLGLTIVQRTLSIGLLGFIAAVGVAISMGYVITDLNPFAVLDGAMASITALVYRLFH